VICAECGTSLPAGSRYCPKCGQAGVPSRSLPATAAAMACSNCGASLPPGSQFCPMCSQAVVGAFSRWAPPLPRPRKRISPLWLLIPALLLSLGWALLSGSPAAQELQRLANLSHTETIAPLAFSVSAHGFSYYKFGVPPGASEVTVTGDFGTDGSPGASGGIEVFLVTEADLINWQYGYSPAAFYTSARVTQGEIVTALPSGAGAYCLVFNNNFSPRTAKSVHTSVTLHYKKW
jgi:RNA polymerase subunit RPABC4/transcription elongation factor Spt4